MTRDNPRPNFHSSQLIRCLAALDLLEGAEPASDFAEELGQWLHFTDAIALSSVHESGMAKVTMPSPVLRDATDARLSAEFERVRAVMVSSITKSFALKGGKAPIQLPLLTPEVSFSPYKQFYEAHQRNMELHVEPLRVNLRTALHNASPALRKLAELDVVMERVLRAREGQLLARVPVLLKKRFVTLYGAHQEQLAASSQADSPAAWMHPGGWLTCFCQNLHTVLLAEVELRLQPSAGLLEAFNQQKDYE